MYTALAQVYDLFDTTDTAKRADIYAAVLPCGGEGVDLGCGTGKLTAELYKRGFKLYGVDSSPEMLRIATENARAHGGLPKFVLGDAATPPTTHPLDFVMAANDVFNYVPHMQTAFENIYACLKSDGVFAFDISSAYKLTHVLAGNTFSQTSNDITYVWQNFKKGNKLIIDFTVFSRVGESYIKTCETQVQYIRTTEEVEYALTEAGFAGVKATAFGCKRKPKDTDERIFMVAHKK